MSNPKHVEIMKSKFWSYLAEIFRILAALLAGYTGASI